MFFLPVNDTSIHWQPPADISLDFNAMRADS